MSHPRQVLPESTYLLTRRCTQRQFLLRPSPKTDAIFLYCLALAASRFGILVHAFVVLSNHYHLVATDPGTNLPEFMRYLNEFTARALNASYGRWESFWAPGSYSAVRLESCEDIIAKIGYALANPVAAGLVARAERWPGLWTAPRELGVRTYDVSRPEGFFRPNGPTPERCTLRLTLPPGFEDPGELAERVKAEVRKLEGKAHASARANATGFLGARAVLRQPIDERPVSAGPRRNLNPHVATKDRSRRIEALQRLKSFRTAYRLAWRALRSGVLKVIFPHGTYALRIRYAIGCAPP